MSLKLSVIIPTLNRASLLFESLHSLKSQTLHEDEFEIIVIDNGSTDNTRSVVENYAQTMPNLRYFCENEPGLHAGRHRGLREAKTDILVFTDDDIEAFPDWLTSVLEGFIDTDVVLVGGNNIPKFVVEPPNWLVRLWERPLSIGGKALPSLSILELDVQTGMGDPQYVWGCNFSIRKDALLEAGGFHPDGMPGALIRFRGDGESHVTKFIRDSGKKCLFHRGATVFHKVTPERMTFEYFRKRGFNQGISDSYTVVRGEASKKRRRGRTILSKMIRTVIGNFKQILGLDNDVDKVLAEMQIGYQEGYLFHQDECRRDSDLVSWVKRTNYLTKGDIHD